MTGMIYMTYSAGCYDIAVIGAGHAGIEAAPRYATKARLITLLSLQSIWTRSAAVHAAPRSGGTAKGHLVRELDALSGEMEQTADRVLLAVENAQPRQRLYGAHLTPRSDRQEKIRRHDEAQAQSCRKTSSCVRRKSRTSKGRQRLRADHTYARGVLLPKPLSSQRVHISTEESTNRGQLRRAARRAFPRDKAGQES